jgi:hypothetical protein
MTDPRMPLHLLPDPTLEDALRRLGPSLAVPAVRAGPNDPAARARRRIAEAGGTSPRLRAWRLRRGLVLAVAALLVMAAVAAAVGLGLPGLRFVFGDPSPVPSASPVPTGPVGPPGSGLGLGTAVTLAEAERMAGFDLRLPTDPTIGPPDAAYLASFGAVSLAWEPAPNLPATDFGGVGLLITEFRGGVDEGYLEKALRSDATLTPVTVGGERGYWIAGPPHFFIYIDPRGEPVDDSRRVVGDTLVWTDGELTLRLESALGMEGALALAETLE